MASLLTVSRGYKNKRKFLLDILTYMNIKLLITVKFIMCSAMSESKSCKVLLSLKLYSLHEYLKD